MSIWTDKEGRIRVAIMAQGKRIHRCLPKGASKSDAKLVEAEMRKAISVRQVSGDPPLPVVMDLYLTHAETLRSPDTAKYHALRCGPWCEGKKASQAEEVANKMIGDMHGHYEAGTINKSLGTMKKALTQAYQKRMIPEDYGDRIKRLPENNQRHIYLTVEQVRELTSHCSEQVRACVWIALLTGCRRGEILKIRPEDVGEKRIRIRSGNTKTLRERTVPIVQALRPWLAYIPIKINEEGLKTGFVRAREKAGIEVNFHDLRHSCASLLINMGVPLEVIRDILGHTTVKTTERYAHLQVDKQEEALSKLSDMVIG